MAGTKFRWRAWLLTGLLALAFKQIYAVADTAQLHWLLWPLATLLNQVGGLAFRPLATGEWLDAEHGLAIVKACAGGNFLIASWLGWLWRWRDRPFGPVLAARAFAAAWLTTLAANAARILLIVHGQDELARLAGLSDPDSHRLIGIAVYFACLWAQLAGARERFSALVAATALYLGVTLLLPALRAWSLGLGGLDAAHVGWTAAVPLAVLLVHGAWRLLRRRMDWFLKPLGQAAHAIARARPFIGNRDGQA